MSKAARNGGLAVAILALGALIFWLARGEGGDGAVRTSRTSAAASGAELPSFGAEGAAAVATPVVVTAADQPAPTASPSGTRLVVHVMWAVDGSPAVDINLKLVAFDQPEAAYRAIRGRTDAQGTWTRAAPPLGKIAVYSDRGESVGGEIREGETTELNVSLATGTTVRGFVVDENEKPVPGAGIWLSDYGDYSHGIVVVNCGPDGRFVLRGVTPWRYVGARAEGHVPSNLSTVKNDAPPEMELRLQLGPPGSGVSGVVVDLSQVPVADAWVQVGPESGWPGRNPHVVGDGPPPVELTTDAAGRFLAADLPPGTIQVAVRSEGWMPWSGWTTAEAGKTAELSIVLQRSARVSGTVRDRSGAPVAGASVRNRVAFSEAAPAETTTDSAGRYVLSDLPQGQQQIIASLDGAGQDKRTFHVQPGGAYAWDAVLGDGLQIRGLVIDTSGASVEGLSVNFSHGNSDGWGRTAKVGTDGRFVLPNCSNVAHVLEVFAADGQLPALVTLGDVRPGPNELRIELPADLRRLASVTGRVTDSAGNVPAGLEVNLRQVLTYADVAGQVNAQTGDFTFESVRAGDYRMWLSAKPQPDLRFDVRGVLPGERRELGTIVMQEGGVVVARLVLPEGLDPTHVDCWLDEANGPFGFGALKGREEGLLERRSEPVPPGDYFVRARGQMVASLTVPVHVASGAEARVDLAIVKGVRTDLRFTMPYAEEHALEFWIADAAGAAVVHERRDAMPMPDANQSLSSLLLYLQPGQYALRVALDGKDSLKTGFDVPTGTDNAKRQEFKLP